MSAKAVYKKVSAENFKASYQAVHKTLLQLAGEGVLLKDAGGKYRISGEWIKSAKSFASGLEKSYCAKTVRFADLSEGDSASAVFEKASDVYYWLMDEAEILPKLSPFYKPCVTHWAHMWPATMVEQNKYAQLTFLMETHFPKVICGNKSALDETIAGYWKKMKGDVCFDSASAHENDTLVFSDYVVSVFWPKKFRVAMDKHYALSNEDMGIAINNVYRLNFGEKINVPVTITRRKALAQQIRKETLEFFKK